MADPLIVDPALQASVIRQFNLRGELSPFLLTNRVVPTFDIGSLTRTLDPTVVTTLLGQQGVRIGTSNDHQYIPIEHTAWEDVDVENRGPTVNPAAGAVITDTGALGSGPHVVEAFINWDAAILDFSVEWRNVGNTATLATWTVFVGTGAPYVHWGPYVVKITGGERVRVITATGGTGNADATFAHNLVTGSAAF